MILIAESGSSKTDWVYIDSETSRKTYFEGIGLNPYNTTQEAVYQEANRLFHSIDFQHISHIYFYGSGCSTTKNKTMIRNGLQALFKDVPISVFHDMEGAARALCKTENGIACILGTGSNACHYNGSEIVKNAVSLGYLLGDEGSGFQLGKKMVHAVYLKIAPKELIHHFQEKYQLSLEDLLAEMYKKPSPNKYIASFSVFIGENRKHPFVANLIQETFLDFLRLVVLPLNPAKDLAVHFTGSIAWFFKQELEETMVKNGFQLGLIKQKPIEELADYHFTQIRKQ
jgi:N-acetylglucosamine kinase-like BadF-type ATPase